MGRNDSIGEQLQQIIEWANPIPKLLKDFSRPNRRIHFRPSSTGISMVGLLPSAPQLGIGKQIRHQPPRLTEQECAVAYDDYKDKSPDKETPEKALQSYLIRDAYDHDGVMAALAGVSDGEGPGEVLFVSDEIALFQDDEKSKTGRKKIVCDILAARRHGKHYIPVLIELKSSRDLKRLEEQLAVYSGIMKDHSTQFASLYAAILDKQGLTFSPGFEPEKWMIWPAPASGIEKHRPEGIKVIGYKGNETFRFFT